MRTQTIQTVLKPLSDVSNQVYLGIGVHTLGLLGWILEQIDGPADVAVTTFSTSEEFLSGFLNLRRKNFISHATMVADLKASKKTVKLKDLMGMCFEEVYLASNHSKILLVHGANTLISVVSSQNNTYGGRAECTYITTDTEIYYELSKQLGLLIKDSVKIDGVHARTTEADRAAGSKADSGIGDFRPFGAAD